jgi:ribosomal protein L11 methyltransferase
MIDVGTGSGILAIYGAMLGAHPILALDIDSEAIRWAKRNIRLNGLSDGIELSLQPVRNLRQSFTLLIANLLPDELLRIIHFLPELVNPDGWLVLSGCLTAQVARVKTVLAKYPFLEHETFCQQDWTCMIFRKAAH